MAQRVGANRPGLVPQCAEPARSGSRRASGTVRVVGEQRSGQVVFGLAAIAGHPPNAERRRRPSQDRLCLSGQSGVAVDLRPIDVDHRGERHVGEDRTRRLHALQCADQVAAEQIDVSEVVSRFGLVDVHAVRTVGQRGSGSISRGIVQATELNPHHHPIHQKIGARDRIVEFGDGTAEQALCIVKPARLFHDRPHLSREDCNGGRVESRCLQSLRAHALRLGECSRARLNERQRACNPSAQVDIHVHVEGRRVLE